MKTHFQSLFKNLTIFIASSWLFYSCVSVYTPNNTNTNTNTNTNKTTNVVKVVSNFPENFDQVSKNKYETATITTNSGDWYFENAMMGSTDNDVKNGAKAIRIKEDGLVRFDTDLTSGIYQIKLKAGLYQSDKTAAFEVRISTNRGNTWNKIGNTITLTDKFLKDFTFTVNTTVPTRFEIVKVDGTNGRLNIDDVSISAYSGSVSPTPNPSPTPTPTPNPSPKPNPKPAPNNVATKDNNLLLGNPSNAISNTSYSNNFLMLKNAYALSYNKSKATANWVSWHVSAAWKGDAQRQNDFRPDSSLPQGWSAVNTRDYTDSGFDRGHICPSDDRDGSVEENQETFLMTNIMPQAPDNNRGVWKNLEEYGRRLVEQGYELYVIAGPYGQGGTGSNGEAQTIGNKNTIVVPKSVWKIIVVLPVGQNDLYRIGTDTRVIAVNIPNTNQAGASNWRDYRVSVDALEKLTGFDFLSDVPKDIQSVIEARVDNN